ncbi:hypothetical protein GCM10010116_24300 [Microbispora rosea subsp. aerata]|nr:hypothetical protein [Microbispora rosea]GGO12111.1 hypothetical protein GCM10010116_24300 [Microbispora rosea subsp. aerata]GIH55641.1 hypothetical protein Mro02_25550 [Microbispora rosea subsp. aerata]GLJ86061.1 hypothetical protein GCM10017588_47940 [Microbispora rosea subsp. aerata]
MSRDIDRGEHGEESVVSRAGPTEATVIPSPAKVSRRGRGSLKGQLHMTDDWDAPEVNDAVAGDFGLLP